MDLEIQNLQKEEEELAALNESLRVRASKFGAQFIPLSLGEYKMFKIRKASQTGNIEYLENILLEDIEDLQERKRKIKERISNFYPQLKVQSQDKFFAQKYNPDFSEDNVTIRENAWYLFGVDYMSNQKIRHYFSSNPHFKIEWINDSSCNIIFSTKEEAIEAIRPHRKGEGMADQNQIWYELEEYQVEGVKRKLYCRLATNKDQKKKEIHGHNSEYYRWVINKEKLNNFVKSKAHYEIRKTKAINKNFDKKSAAVQKQKKEEQSSSGVDSSSEQVKEKIEVKENIEVKEKIEGHQRINVHQRMNIHERMNIHQRMQPQSKQQFKSKLEE